MSNRVVYLVFQNTHDEQIPKLSLGFKDENLTGKISN